MEALGMVETNGLVAAIEATDVMLKTAEVHLVNHAYVGGGLVATLMQGDVAAIQTAVQAAQTAVVRLNESGIVSVDVIPRPAAGIEGMILPPTPPAEEAVKAPTPEPDEQPAPVTEQQPVQVTPPKAPLPKKLELTQLQQLLADGQPLAPYLSRFKINELRNFAKRQPEFVKAHKNVYQLSKNDLVAQLIAFYQPSNNE